MAIARITRKRKENREDDQDDEDVQDDEDDQDDEVIIEKGSENEEESDADPYETDAEDNDYEINISSSNDDDDEPSKPKKQKIEKPTEPIASTSSAKLMKTTDSIGPKTVSTVRMTRDQKNKLIKFVEEHKDQLIGNYDGTKAPIRKKLLEELSKKLNVMPGATKNSSKWQQVHFSYLSNMFPELIFFFFFSELQRFEEAGKSQIFAGSLEEGKCTR